MTERKPSALSWQRWIDRQISDATERGEFEDLPGAGRPLPALDKSFDELWWVKAKLHSEGLTYLPPSLALRKEAHDALEEAMQANSEAEVRRIVEDLNARIRDANSKGVGGPAIMLRPLDVERIVRKWYESRT